MQNYFIDMIDGQIPFTVDNNIVMKFDDGNLYKGRLSIALEGKTVEDAQSFLDKTFGGAYMRIKNLDMYYNNKRLRFLDHEIPRLKEKIKIIENIEEKRNFILSISKLEIEKDEIENKINQYYKSN